MEASSPQGRGAWRWRPGSNWYVNCSDLPDGGQFLPGVAAESVDAGQALPASGASVEGVSLPGRRVGNRQILNRRGLGIVRAGMWASQPSPGQRVTVERLGYPCCPFPARSARFPGALGGLITPRA